MLFYLLCVIIVWQFPSSNVRSSRAISPLLPPPTVPSIINLWKTMMMMTIPIKIIIMMMMTIPIKIIIMMMRKVIMIMII